jgi:hypothetical protein
VPKAFQGDTVKRHLGIKAPGLTWTSLRELAGPPP